MKTKRVRLRGKIKKILRKIHIPKKTGKVIKYTVISLVAVLTAFLFSTAFREELPVDEPAMEPTFLMNDTVTLNKLSYMISSPKRFDLVAVRPGGSDESRIYIRRVVGLSGERIRIVDGIIYMNDEPLNYPVEGIFIADGGQASEEFHIPDGEYFLLGDSPSESTDSRTAAFGTVKKKNILGKVR